MKKIFLIIILLISSRGFSQCEKIRKDIDKYTDKVKWDTPMVLNENSFRVCPIHFFKSLIGVDTLYTMLLSCNSTNLSYGKGVYILFYNGSKIIKEDVDITVRPSVNQIGEFNYTSVIELTKKEVDLLKSFTIEAFRLYIYEGDIGDDRYQLKELMKCLIAAK